jgi:hypothetical protein
MKAQLCVLEEKQPVKVFFDIIPVHDDLSFAGGDADDEAAAEVDPVAPSGGSPLEFTERQHTGDACAVERAKEVPEGGEP